MALKRLAHTEGLSVEGWVAIAIVSQMLMEESESQVDVLAGHYTGALPMNTTMLVACVIAAILTGALFVGTIALFTSRERKDRRKDRDDF